jgi:hypothetical protein
MLAPPKVPLRPLRSTKMPETQPLQQAGHTAAAVAYGLL